MEAYENKEVTDEMETCVITRALPKILAQDLDDLPNLIRQEYFTCFDDSESEVNN